MKYMLIMRSTDEAIEASKDMDFDEIIAAMKDVFNGAAGGSCDYFDALSLGALLSEGGGYRE